MIERLYEKALDGFGEEAAVRAIERAITECQFWPPVAVVVGFAGGTDKRDVEGQAALAWMRVDEDVRRCGSYRAPDYSDDPAIAQAIALMGGWVALCGSPEDAWEWRGKEFRANYARLKQSGETFQVELRGIHDSAKVVGGVNPILLAEAKKRMKGGDA